jgi:hypothetical protein
VPIFMELYSKELKISKEKDLIDKPFEEVDED